MGWHESAMRCVTLNALIARAASSEGKVSPLDVATSEQSGEDAS